MSDLKSMDLLLGNYSRNDLDCQLGERETEGDFESNELQAAKSTSEEEFRSLINTNSRKNSEITIETARMMINSENTNQVTRKLDEIIREDLNHQILEVSNSTITEKVLSRNQNVVGIKKSD